jgi:hypothetical protein
LQRKFGTREAWCGVLAPFAKSFQLTTTATSASAVTAGVLTMGAMSKVAVAVASLAIVGAGVWLALDRSEPVALATKSEAPMASTAPAAVEPVEKASDDRIALAPESNLLAPVTRQESAASVPTSAVPTAAICIRFVDPNGRALAGVEFRMDPKQSWAESAHSTTSTTSDSEGRAALSFLFPADYSELRLGLSAVRSGCATLNLHAVPDPGRVVDLGEVVIHPEARVYGRVQDAGGASLSGVTVGLIADAKVDKDLDATRNTCVRRTSSGPGQSSRSIASPTGSKRSIARIAASAAMADRRAYSSSTSWQPSRISIVPTTVPSTARSSESGP